MAKRNNNNNTAVKGEAPKKKRGVGRWFKETFSELKKVTWPTFLTVVKQTGVVLLVTLIFLLVLIGIDQGLSQLFLLLKKGLTSEVVSPLLSAVGSAFRGVPILGGGWL